MSKSYLTGSLLTFDEYWFSLKTESMRHYRHFLDGFSAGLLDQRF